jgi:biopolymer transport protein ExbD
MLIYLIKFSACLAVFMVFYKLLLEKSSVHQLKRFYLLSALGVSLIIPSLTFIEYIEPIVAEELTSFVISDFEMVKTLPEIVAADYTPIILWSLYGLGVFIFLLKFCLNLNAIISRIRRNPKLKSDGFINVLISNLKIPHTFFSYIFFNKDKFEHNDIPKEVLIHEQTHAKQKHSIDVLLLEVLQIIFWFNPLIYVLKRDVKLNHEFLADRAVLQNGIEPSTYQTILLAFSSHAQHQELANAINYSSIKKRFTVMNTHTSKKSIWLRSLLLLPVLAILFYGFAEHKQVEKEISELSETHSSEGVSEALMQEYNDFIITFTTTHKLEFSKYERIVSIYNLMSEAQKASVEPYPKVPVVDLSETKAKKPTKEQFESWKNNKEFAIWIDRQYLPNSILNEMSVDDIAHYSSSYTNINARSEKFPQPYQFSLYTKKGFSSIYKNYKVKEYKEMEQVYLKATFPFYLNDKLSLSDKSELKLLKERCDRLYNSLSKEELEKYNLLPVAPVPMEKSSQKKATPKQLAEYNKLAKKYNEQNINNQIIKLKDVDRLEYLYKFMSDAQKENAQPYPNFPPPPAKAPAPPIKVIKSELTWVLLNTKGQFLMNDKLSNLKSIETEFKNISGNKNKSKDIVFKHEEDSPKDIINKVNLLIANYNLKNIYDTLPPPPPPPAPPVKKGNGPNGNNNYPVPPQIPEDASPEQREKMQTVIDDFEKTYKRKVRQTKTDDGEMISIIANDDVYEPTQDENKVKTGFLKIKGTPHYYVSINSAIKYYNRQGFEVSKTGIKISKDQVNASDVVPGQYITKVYSDSKVVSEFKDNEPNTYKDIIDIPSPPKSISRLDHIIAMAKKNATFFYEGKKVSSDSAIQLIKKYDDLNIFTKDLATNAPKIFLTKNTTVTADTEILPKSNK